MPLTARNADGTVIDATACGDDEWFSVYRTALTTALTCRGCGHPMIAKRSSKGLRFFAHRADRPIDCPSAGESVEHLELKRLLADLIRAHGAEAVLEATPNAGDLGGWRADVLGVTVQGRRVAFEVQLAAMTVEEGQTRSAKYQADGIGVAWITSKHAHWLSRIPSARVISDDAGTWATRGLGKWNGTSWTQPEPVALQRLVVGLMNDSVRAVHAGYHAEEAGARTLWIDDAVLLVPAADAAAMEHQRAAIAAIHAQELQRQENHERNMRLLRERQERVLQDAIADAVETCIGAQQVWLGVPPTQWSGTTPTSLREALGNEKTAQGLVIWAGASRADLRLWAVICPVAARCSYGLGVSWAKRGVRVYAATHREAERLAGALGRQREGITVRMPGWRGH